MCESVPLRSYIKQSCIENEWAGNQQYQNRLDLISIKFLDLQEQAYLEFLCKREKNHDWKYIASEMKANFLAKSRSSKQCRERFHNFIRYRNEQTGSQGWGEEEDVVLLQAYIQVGSKWVQISKKMPGRSENCIKNRFYGKLRKFLRTINKIQKTSKSHTKKPLKQHMLTKILSKQQQPPSPLTSSSISQSQSLSTAGHNQQVKITHKTNEQFVSKLKYDLLRYILEPGLGICGAEMEGLLEGIHRFNVMSKGDNIRENRQGRNRKRKRLPPVKNRQDITYHHQGRENRSNLLTQHNNSTEPPQHKVPEPEIDNPLIKDSSLEYGELQMKQLLNDGQPLGSMLVDEISQLFQPGKIRIRIGMYDNFQFQ